MHVGISNFHESYAVGVLMICRRHVSNLKDFAQADDLMGLFLELTQLKANRFSAMAAMCSRSFLILG